MRRAILQMFVGVLFAASHLLIAGETRNSTSISNITGTGGRAIAMGGAFIALSDDATAASWNPAGLAQLTKPEFSLVYEAVRGDLDVSSEYRIYRTDLSVRSIDRTLFNRTEFDDSQIGFASATYPFRFGSRNVVGQVSYRRIANFPDLSNRSSSRMIFPGSAEAFTFDTSDSYESQFDGAIDSYSLSVAASPFDKLRLGLTANYLMADVQNREAYGSPDSQEIYLDEYTSSYDFSGISVDFGLLFEPHEKLRFGAVYHSGFKTGFDYANRNVFTNEAGSSSFQGVRASSDVRWPSGWGVGLAFQPLNPLTFSADYTQTAWSDAFIDSYDDHFTYYDSDTRQFVGFVLGQEHAAFPQLYSEQKDTSSTRFGAEYVFFARSLVIPLRGGYFQEDQLASFFGGDQPTYDGYSLGFGVGIGGIQIDAAYVKTAGTDRGRAGLTPVYNNNSQVVAITEVVHETLDVSSERFLISMMYRF